MPKPLSDHRAPIEIKDPVSERIDRTIESHIREVVPAEVISAREAVDKAGLAEMIASSLTSPHASRFRFQLFGFRVQGDDEARRGMQDGTHRIRECDCPL